MVQCSPSQQYSASQPTHTVVSILSNFMFSRSSSSSVSNSSSFPSLSTGDGSFSVVMATAAAVVVLGGEADITVVCLKSDSAAGEGCLSVTTGLLITVGFADGIWTQRDKHWGCLSALMQPKAKIQTYTWTNTVSLSLSLRLTTFFRWTRVSRRFIGAKDDRGGGDNWSCR